MVMATVEKTNNARLSFALCACIIISPTSLAGEWTFVPSLGLTETLSDNVELTRLNQKSSLVSQVIVGINTTFISKKAQLSFSGTETLAAYSHNSELNDDFQEMQLNGLLSLWSDGPQVIFSSGISNISQNDSDNSLADLVSGDTIQQIVHSAGLQYNITNSNHKLASSVLYNITESEDNIGESQGYSASINSENGNAARLLFWNINGSFSHQENNNNTGENYTIESKVGVLTPVKINPFIRFYNEGITGNISATPPNTIPSWGPGIQWLATKHLIIDLSYNYVQDDENKSDDYIAASLDWQPSERTSLKAGYSQRFFGNSYNFDFQHKTKRLNNSITYDESIETFDRNSYVDDTSSNFWCLEPISSSVSANDCFPSSQPPSDTSGYSLIPINSLTPVENNEFTINKRLTWVSTLSLARTKFAFTASTREREALNTNIVDEYIDVDFTITRRTSPKSNLSFSTSYSENLFDKSNPDGSQQKDIYKILSSTYSRDLASSLSAFFSLRYLDRESSREDRTYTEARVSLNITKEF
jgi:uncharacterized protein (PEP-CTERM system associated)